MKYSLTHTSAEGEETSTLILSGHLTILTSFPLYAELMAYAKQQDSLRLEIRDVEEIDGTFLQLLLVLSKFQEEHQKPFYLHLDLNPASSTMVDIADIKKSIINNFLP